MCLKTAHSARRCVTIQPHSLCEARTNRGGPCGDGDEEARIYQVLDEKAWAGQVRKATQSEKIASVTLGERCAWCGEGKGEESVRGL